MSSTISRPPVSSLQGYDLWANTYDSFNNPMLTMVDRAFELNAPDFAGRDVLELGCGTGRNIRRASLGGAKSYTGVDQSSGMLKQAREKNPDTTVALVESNLDGALPFESERFDFILVTLVFEHIPFLLPVLTEAQRVLKPGGTMRVLEIHSGLVESGTGAHFEHDGIVYDLPSFPHPALEWEATFTRAGFDLRHIKDLYADSQAIERCHKLLKHSGKPVLIEIEATKKGATLAMRTPTEVIREWEKAFNARDPQTVASLYHDDATNLQIAVGQPLEGKEAILADSTGFFSNIPDSFTNIENLIANGEWVSIEWSGGGTFKPTGKRFEFRGCGFFRIVDGKIKTQRGYWDLVSWCKAVGVPLE